MMVRNSYPKGHSKAIELFAKSQCLKAGTVVSFSRITALYTIVEVSSRAGIGGFYFEVFLDRPLVASLRYAEDFTIVHPATNAPTVNHDGPLVSRPFTPTMKTHYAYLSGPNNIRQVTALLDLGAACLTTRRKMVHALLMNGELLAILPPSEIEWTKDTLNDYLATRKKRV